MKTHAKQLFQNAMLLTLASLLMRTVGVAFQVSVSNRVGAEAMGLFSLLSGVYGFALTLATSGIHLGVTRLVVDSIGADTPEQIPAAMKRASVYALFFGCLASCLLVTFAAPIGLHWLHDARTIPSLRLLAITLPLIALASVWSGYFTAVRRPYKNAAVQVFEQAVKIGTTMYLLGTLFADSVERTCYLLVLGGALAEILSFLLNFLLYRLDRRRNFPARSARPSVSCTKKLLSITLPIALTAYVRSGLLTLQHILIPSGLRRSGASHAAALVAYGSIQSMALPVILYPAALISSFSGLLVPELAEAEIRDSRRHICYMISRVWSLSMLFSIGVAGVLICFSSELGNALYPDTDAARYIRLLAPLIPIMYVDTATDAMMKGLGEQVYSMKINIADALISVVLVALLIPRYGITGYIITIYFSELFNTVCSIAHLLSISRTPVRLAKWVYKPLLSIVGATSAVRLLLGALPLRLPSLPLTIVLHCLLVTGLYLLLLRLTGAIEREDVCWVRELLSVRKA
ncbi:MAG: polysaccharide biosynthesis C-terminal domain-containing protein [Clostridia bacterium]|nr:polysaccharide biosynthesis C-terminal domain-containing protein [Clostridia bacterium]